MKKIILFSFFLLQLPRAFAGEYCIAKNKINYRVKCDDFAQDKTLSYSSQDELKDDMSKKGYTPVAFLKLDYDEVILFEKTELASEKYDYCFGTGGIFYNIACTDGINLSGKGNDYKVVTEFLMDHKKYNFVKSMVSWRTPFGAGADPVFGYIFKRDIL